LGSGFDHCAPALLLNLFNDSVRRIPLRRAHLRHLCQQVLGHVDAAPAVHVLEVKVGHSERAVLVQGVGGLGSQGFRVQAADVGVQDFRVSGFGVFVLRDYWGLGFGRNVRGTE
jgi:hypothetical protein